MTTADDYINAVLRMMPQPHRRAACARPCARRRLGTARRSCDACRLLFIGGAARQRRFRFARCCQNCRRDRGPRGDVSHRLDGVTVSSARIRAASHDSRRSRGRQPRVRGLHDGGRVPPRPDAREAPAAYPRRPRGRFPHQRGTDRRPPAADAPAVYWIDVMFALFTDRSQRAFEMLSKTRVVRA
jgi:hypothetical protein